MTWCEIIYLTFICKNKKITMFDVNNPNWYGFPRSFPQKGNYTISCGSENLIVTTDESKSVPETGSTMTVFRESGIHAKIKLHFWRSQSVFPFWKFFIFSDRETAHLLIWNLFAGFIFFPYKVSCHLQPEEVLAVLIYLRAVPYESGGRPDRFLLISENSRCEIPFGSPRRI